jgi:MFS family permease
MSTDPPTDPRPRAHAEVAGLAGYNFLAMLRRGFFYTFLIVYLREKLGLSVSFTALIGAANAVTSTLGQVLLWGRRSDRLDRRAGLMVTGELIAGLGYLATFALFRVTLHRVSPFATTMIVVGCLATIELFWSMTDVGFRAAIAQVTHAGNRGRFLGKLDFIGLGGLGLGLLLAGYLYRDGRGIEDGSIWLLAAGCILAGVPLIRATLLHLDGIVLGEAGPPANGGRPDRAFLRAMAVLAVPVLGLWSFQGIHTFFIRLSDTAAASDRDLSLIRMVFWLAGGLLAPLAGTLVDRFGSRRTYALALLACSGIALAFLPTRSVLYAAATLAAFGAALTLFRTASYALTAELTPASARGRCFALYNAVMSLGWGVSGLLIGGPVADLSIRAGASVRAAYGASFVVGAGLGLAGLAVFLVTTARARRLLT